MSTQFTHSVLIVDDTEANVDILVETLADTYDLMVAMDGETALEITRESLPDLILLDIMMPGMSGYDVCEQLKAEPATANIPIIFITAMSAAEDEEKGLKLGAVDYITKPFNPALVSIRVRNHLDLKMHRDNLEQLVNERTAELQLTQDAMIESLGILADCRDPETGGHIRRTQSYVRVLAEHLQDHPRFCDFLDDETIDLLEKSAPLHDIGKIGIADSILLKPGRLTDDEFEEMKRHAELGYESLQRCQENLGKTLFLELASIIAYTHQEKWDGSGYPRGLIGDEIPIPGRLMALADVYDALISKRVYKEPFTHDKAVSIISEGAGQHFDPDIVGVFETIHETFRRIAIELADYQSERDNLQRL